MDISLHHDTAVLYLITTLDNNKKMMTLQIFVSATYTIKMTAFSNIQL